MRNKWFLLILITFIFSFVFQLWLENAHKADSLGLWYTSLSAIIYTFVIVIVIRMVVAILNIIHRARNKKAKH
jgi:hypothetical protein